MISASNILITSGTFTQQSAARSKGFDLLSQNVATQALHNSGEISDPVACHPETRAAILTGLEEWAESPSYDYPIKWISGSAGVGKTTIMHTIAETLERRKLLLASFFFWRTGERSSSATFFIPTLAYQIAISIPAARPYIERAIDDNPHIFTLTLKPQSRALIINPITALYKEHTQPSNLPRILVIDGLDECMDAERKNQDIDKQREILELLHWILQNLPAPFALLIASRPEYHIKRTFDTSFKECSSLLMLNDIKNVDADIERFYVNKFREIQNHHPLRSYLCSPEWPSHHIIQRLVLNASGQFIYASTVVKFVGAAKKNPSDQLDIILDTKVWGSARPFQALDALYSAIFSMIEDQDLCVTLRVLGALLLGRPWTGFELAPNIWDEFLGLQQGEVERLMLGLESILRIRATDRQTFRFYHLSLSEFLFNSTRSGPFFIDKNMVIEDLIKQGVHHLTTANDDIGGFIADNMGSWPRERDNGPSVELHNIIEQARFLIHPSHLRERYPAFLIAVHGSSLPESERLHNMHMDLYRLHLMKIIALYFEDDSLAFLILVWLSRYSWTGRDIYEGRMIHSRKEGGLFEDFIDNTYPLTSESARIDREEGLYLYKHEGDIDHRPEFKFASLTVFVVTVMQLIKEMTGAGDWYAKSIWVLVKSMWRPSTLFLGGNWNIFGHLHVAFNDLLPLASSQQDLREFLEDNPIPKEYLQFLQDPIERYISRQDRKLQEAGRKIERGRFWRSEEGTGIWVPWVDSKELGKAVNIPVNILEIDE